MHTGLGMRLMQRGAETDLSWYPVFLLCLQKKRKIIIKLNGVRPQIFMATEVLQMLQLRLLTFSSRCWNFLCSFPKSGTALTCDWLDVGFAELVESASTFCACVCVRLVPMSAVCNKYCQCRWGKEHQKQPSNSTNSKKYFVLRFCIKYAVRY